MNTISDTTLTDYTESLVWSHYFGAELVTGAHSENIHLPTVEGLTPDNAQQYLKTLKYLNKAVSTAQIDTCPYCSELLGKRELVSNTHSFPGVGAGWHSYSQNVFYCPECGWWFKVITESLQDNRSQNSDYRTVIYEAIIRRYSLGDKMIPEETLRKYMLSHPNAVHGVHPQAFEKFVASVYRDFFACEAKHVGGPNDHGVDVFAIVCNEPFLIQTKRRASSAAIESVSTVREFIGTLVEHGATRGHIVTTARGFSRNAKELVHSPNVARAFVELGLISKNDLLSMLEITKEKLSETWEKPGGNEKPQYG